MGWIADFFKDLPVSAAMKERLALAEEKHALIHARDEATIAEQAEQIAVLQTENEELKTENATLRLQLDNATASPEVPQEQQKQPLHTSRLSEDEERILLFLTDHKSPTADIIGSSLEIKSARTDYYLGKLREEKYIWGLSFGDPTSYGLEQKGSAYLMEHDLI